MSLIENYQSRKNLLANNLQNKQITASDTEGFTTLINKIEDIIVYMTDGIVLFSNNATPHINNTIQLYALSLRDSVLVQGETINFTTQHYVKDTKKVLSTTFNRYTVQGDGEIHMTASNIQLIIYNDNQQVYGGGVAEKMSVKIKNSQLFYNYLNTSYQYVCDVTSPVEILINQDATITKNTFSYNQTAITNNYGIATISYTCPYTGKLNIVAKNNNFTSNLTKTIISD